MSVPAVPIYKALAKAGLEGQPLLDATEAVTSGDATLRDVLRVIPAITGKKAELAPIPHLSIIYQELEAAGLKGQVLEDAANTVLNGDSDLDSVLEVAAVCAVPNSGKLSEDTYTQIFKDFNIGTPTKIAAMILIRAGRDNLAGGLIREFNNETDYAALEMIWETECPEFTDVECLSVIEELREFGFNNAQIIDSLKAIRSKQATISGIVKAQIQEQNAAQTEDGKPIAFVETTFSLEAGVVEVF